MVLVKSLKLSLDLVANRNSLTLVAGPSLGIEGRADVHPRCLLSLSWRQEPASAALDCVFCCFKNLYSAHRFSSWMHYPALFLPLIRIAYLNIHIYTLL